MTRKRTERAPRPDPEAVGTARPGAAPPGSERLKLPHERDESPTELAKGGERAVRQREIIHRAQEDLDSGQQDTDCRNPHGPDSACPPVPESAQPAKPDAERKRR